MIKKLGLTTIVLSALLLSGCGGGSNSSSSKSGDLIIDNDSIYGIGKVFIKKTSDTNPHGISILTQPIAAGTEVALSTKICDTNIDIKIITTDNRAFYSRNKYLPCDGTFTLHIYNSSN